MFEKVTRVCPFCGLLGHDMSSCADHARLSYLMQNPAQTAKLQAHDILSPTIGPWILNPTLIPRPQQLGRYSGFKRQHSPSFSDLPPNYHPNQPSLNYSPSVQAVIPLFVESDKDVPETSSKPKRPRPVGLVLPDCFL